jgi:8-oxo-dGTP diphosphatase
MSRYTFIYGTGNTAKLKHMRGMLKGMDNVEIIGITETGIDIPAVDESGNSPIENARIKALSYYKVIKHPVFSCDSGFYIEGLTDEEQPGIHIRRISGKTLSDDEMTEYYANIAKRLGGRAVAQYKNAICLVINENEIYEHFGEDISGEGFYITETPHSKRVAGFPLDCISVNIENGKYYYDSPKESGISAMGNGFRAFFKRVLEEIEERRKDNEKGTGNV